MGQKVKIADLKRWDVFKTDNYDLRYIVFNDGFCCTWNQAYQFNLKKDFCFCGEEVELLGRMEFKEE